MLPSLKVRIEADPSDAVSGLKQVEGAVQDASSEAKRSTAAFSSLNKAFSSLNKSFPSLNKAFSSLNKSLSSVKLGATKATYAIGRGFTAATTKLGAVASGSSNALRNISMQLNQVGQQAAVTGNFMGALAIQLPDMLAGFGGLAPAIAGAALGLSVALLPTLIEAINSSKGLTEQLESLSEAMGSVNQAQSGASKGLFDLIEDYGRYATAAKEVLAAQRDIAALQAEGALTETAGAIAEAFGQIEEVNRRGVVQTSRRLIDNLVEQFDIGAGQAHIFANALREVGDAQGPDAQVAAIQKLREQILIATGGISSMDDETREVYKSLLEAEIAAARLAAIDVASNIGAGADEAGRMASNFQLAVDAFNRLSEQESKVYSGRGGDPRSFEGREGEVTSSTATTTAPRASGGGGGGAARVDPLIAQLESIKAALATQEEALTLSHQSQIETLQDAFGKRMLTQEEFQALSLKSATDYADAMNEIERAKAATRYSSIAGAFGDVASLMDSGNKKLFKIGKAAALAEATVNGYSAAVAAWDRGMKVGGPPTAAAFAGASLLRTGSMISSIASQTVGGSSGGASSGGTVATTEPTQTQSPLDVRVTGLGPDDLIRGSDVSSLFDRLQDEAGDRGVRMIFA